MLPLSNVEWKQKYGAKLSDKEKDEIKEKNELWKQGKKPTQCWQKIRKKQIVWKSVSGNNNIDRIKKDQNWVMPFLKV